MSKRQRNCTERNEDKEKHENEFDKGKGTHERGLEMSRYRRGRNV